MSIEDAPWKLYYTNPIVIEALEVGRDIKLDGIPDGDFILRTDAFSEVFHCPRAEFVEHYSEILDGQSTEGVSTLEGGPEPLQEGPERTGVGEARDSASRQTRFPFWEESTPKSGEVDSEESKRPEESGEESNGPGFTCSIEKQSDGTPTARARSRRQRSSGRKQTSPNRKTRN